MAPHARDTPSCWSAPMAERRAIPGECRIRGGKMPSARANGSIAASTWSSSARPLAAGQGRQQSLFAGAAGVSRMPAPR